MSAAKQLAEISAKMAEHMLEVDFRIGADQLILSYVVIDLAAKGVLSAGLLDSVRKVDAPPHLPPEDAALFSKILNERLDALAAGIAKVKGDRA